jgi:hypothetical protein
MPPDGQHPGTMMWNRSWPTKQVIITDEISGLIGVSLADVPTYNKYRAASSRSDDL